MPLMTRSPVSDRKVTLAAAERLTAPETITVPGPVNPATGLKGNVPVVGVAGSVAAPIVVLPPRLRSPRTRAVMVPAFRPVPAELVGVDPWPPSVLIASAVAAPGTITFCTFGSSWQPANVTRTRESAERRREIMERTLMRRSQYTEHPDKSKVGKRRPGFERLRRRGVGLERTGPAADRVADDHEETADHDRREENVEAPFEPVGRHLLEGR